MNRIKIILSISVIIATLSGCGVKDMEKQNTKIETNNIESNTNTADKTDVNNISNTKEKQNTKIEANNIESNTNTADKTDVNNISNTKEKQNTKIEANNIESNTNTADKTDVNNISNTKEKQNTKTETNNVESDTNTADKTYANNIKNTKKTINDIKSSLYGVWKVTKSIGTCRVYADFDRSIVIGHKLEFYEKKAIVFENNIDNPKYIIESIPEQNFPNSDLSRLLNFGMNINTSKYVGITDAGKLSTHFILVDKYTLIYSTDGVYFEVKKVS